MKKKGNFLSQIKSSVESQLSKSQGRDLDINEQLSSLRESDVKVTFSDIWHDYKMYRRSYFYHQVIESPKKFYQRNEVKVDVDKFSFFEYFIWVLKHGQDLPYDHPASILCKLLILSFIMGGSWILTKPMKIYYDYKDPLLKDCDDSLVGISAEVTLRRLKYKKKMANWQTI